AQQEAEQQEAEQQQPQQPAAAPTEFAVLETLSGKTYEAAEVVAVEAGALRVSHANGVARVLAQDLPDEIRELFPFDPETAAKADAAYRAAEQRRMAAL